MKNPAKTPFEYVVNVTRIVLVLLLLSSTGEKLSSSFLREPLLSVH